MKDFNARLEEIRRRSEELKEKERRRKKRLLTVIPAVLCVVCCLFLIVPGSDRATATGGRGSDNGSAYDVYDQEMLMESYSGSSADITRISITGKGLDRTVSDPDAVARICQTWAQLTARTPNFSVAGSGQDGADQDPMGNEPQEGEHGKTSPEDHYIVSFLNADGTARQYKLNQNVLTELSTGESDFLKEDELTRLYSLLDLPVD